MKTIYNLEVGDSYYIIDVICDKPVKFTIKYNPSCSMGRSMISEEYTTYLKYLSLDMVYLTMEDCWKAIEKRKALAKINKRASELGDTGKFKNDSHSYLEIDYRNNKITAFVAWGEHRNHKLVFEAVDTADIIFKELPEEVKLVLEVD